MTDKPILAYAVTEPFERTGAIIFATSNIAARRAGADEYHDGDIGGMSCRRAPWADRFAGQPVPVSMMVAHGWHFECTGCGRRIDTDLPDLWENEAGPKDTGRELVLARRRYRNWTPDRIIGTQYSAVFCDAECKGAHDAYTAKCKAKEAHAIAVFEAKILKRFPDAIICVDEGSLRPHAYATTRKGRIVVQQVCVDFEFPGMKYGPATLRWDGPPSEWMTRERKAYFSCCNGDREAFEAYAAATKSIEQVRAA